MFRVIMLIPTDTNVGLTSVSLGIVHSIEKNGVPIMVFKPITQPLSYNSDQTTEVLRSHSNAKVIEGVEMSYTESLLANDQKDILMEKIVAHYHDNIKKAEIVLIEGLIPTQQHRFAQLLNYEIAKALGAEIIFVTVLNHNTAKELKKRIKLIRSEFGGAKNKNITGVIINKLNAPIYKGGSSLSDLSEIFDQSTKNRIAKIDTKTLTENCPLPILGCIPWNFDLIAIRVIDIANHLNATILHEGALQKRRIQSVIFCGYSVSNVIEVFAPGSLLVTSSDRHDIIISTCLAVMNGVEIGALLLTGGYPMAQAIHNLCHRAFESGLPVLMVEDNTWQTLLNLQKFSLEVNANDHEKIEKIKQYITLHINQKWINSLPNNSQGLRQVSSPLSFRYRLTTLARKANKRIILPEGNEPRTVKAAAICAERGIAICILLGEPNEIKQVAARQGIELGPGIEIITPKSIRENYINRLVELRKNKGMNEILAREQLKDNVVLGTMMLEKDEVDGLVSGAIHTTANTIRPSLQLIKTANENSIVSSIFFMLLPEQVLVYGDCAINPDPTAEELSEIAIQSANSAKAFGIEPRVAMISYSTGNSGTGTDVDKVREATRLAKAKRSDLLIDGPLQYDAAIMADVAKSKAPNSPVAGRATVFIFPDLNTGNTTYKAVQRSANLLSIGPMLQGMRKPVNDLSRGALVDDIVYTIALTSIQATQNN